MSEATVDNGRRTWLITSAAMGGVGAAAVAVPFVSTFQPSERAKAADATEAAILARTKTAMDAYFTQIRSMVAVAATPAPHQPTPERTLGLPYCGAQPLLPRARRDA